MLRIERFTFNAFEENTYVLFDDNGEAVIVDPGCYERTEQNELDEFIAGKTLRVVKLLNTHCHIDHVLGNFHVKEKYKVPLFIHKKDEEVLLAVKSYASNYGFHGYQESLPDGFLSEGDVIMVGTEELKTIFLPGHAPGHVGFYSEENRMIFSGDVLFRRSIGRTDLRGGNLETLIESIHKKMFTLPDEVVVYPGHGSTTTIGEEKVSNPYCAISLLK